MSQPSEVIPPETSIIGYVTAGNFSLSLGEGHAIGCLPVSELFDIKEQAKRYRCSYLLDVWDIR